ncbi:MAG TPA: VOC family protein [Usitatibacter sp.]|nr:VOC family protein [Usitatibacter sp.]
MKVETYIFFEGRCDEALDFYEKALGAKVEMRMRYSESPDPVPKPMLPPGGANKIMHASFTVGETRIMCSDGHVQREPNFQSFSLGISAADEAEARRVYGALIADGGEQRSPLQKTFFSPCFGMLRDKFGVGWMVIVDPH